MILLPTCYDCRALGLESVQVAFWGESWTILDPFELYSAVRKYPSRIDPMEHHCFHRRLNMRSFPHGPINFNAGQNLLIAIIIPLAYWCSPPPASSHLSSNSLAPVPRLSASPCSFFSHSASSHPQNHRHQFIFDIIPFAPDRQL